MLYKVNKSLINRQLLTSLAKRFCVINTNSNSKQFRSTKSLEIRDKSAKNINKIETKSEINDYFGINDTNNKEISGIYGDKAINLDKFRPLLERRDAKLNDEKLMVTTFGKVRLDSDNEPVMHGHYEPSNPAVKFDIKEFESQLNCKREAEDSDPNQSETAPEVSDKKNIFEEQYFDGLSVGSNVAKSLPNDKPVDKNNSEFNFIDKQYFEPLFKSKINFKFNEEFNDFLSEQIIELKTAQNWNLRRSYRNMRSKPEERVPENSLDLKAIQSKSPLKSELFSFNFEPNIDLNEKTKEEVMENAVKLKIEEQMNIELEEEVKKSPKFAARVPRTGAKYLEDIHSGQESPKYPKLFTQEVKDFRFDFNLKGEKLDSKGFRILSSQVFDYTKFTHEDIVDLLVKSILFNDVDIVAINKPYGMAMHTKDQKSGPVLTDYLEKLNKRIDCSKLYTVHRLDKDTTGVLLLAKTQQKANYLNKMFLNHEIQKRYICITRGVPEVLEGIIDIPMEMGRCDGRERMVLRPEAVEEFRSVIKPSTTAKRAVTQYKVVSQSQNAAFLEVWPQTGVRHQIRVHLGFGLRCPILGDNKYSHLDKIAPQKLTSDMLLALNVRQSKVRHIPMHLHAKQYCLPGAGTQGRDIFINAPIPHHIHKNMSKLGLRD